jgi:ABC-type lipoprotein export system ATPase subunit
LTRGESATIAATAGIVSLLQRPTDANAGLDDDLVGPHADGQRRRLSGGERQGIGIARALMARPAALLADEPTASLDGDLSAQVSALLTEQARERGVAALVVSHDDAPLAHADRHLHLAAGSLEQVGAATG